MKRSNRLEAREVVGLEAAAAAAATTTRGAAAAGSTALTAATSGTTALATATAAAAALATATSTAALATATASATTALATALAAEAATTATAPTAGSALRSVGRLDLVGRSVLDVDEETLGLGAAALAGRVELLGLAAILLVAAVRLDLLEVGLKDDVTLLDGRLLALAGLAELESADLGRLVLLREVLLHGEGRELGLDDFLLGRSRGLRGPGGLGRGFDDLGLAGGDIVGGGAVVAAALAAALLVGLVAGLALAALDVAATFAATAATSATTAAAAAVVGTTTPADAAGVTAIVAVATTVVGLRSRNRLGCRVRGVGCWVLGGGGGESRLGPEYVVSSCSFEV